MNKNEEIINPMTEEQYEMQKGFILSDPRYPPALREWMLKTLESIYKTGKPLDDNNNHPFD